MESYASSVDYAERMCNQSDNKTWDEQVEEEEHLQLSHVNPSVDNRIPAASTKTPQGLNVDTIPAPPELTPSIHHTLPTTVGQ